jgi:phosphoglycerate dehydrogenase-like enzyme
MVTIGIIGAGEVGSRIARAAIVHGRSTWHTMAMCHAIPNN